MNVFYVTFGQKYRTEPHPVLGDRPQLPDGWLTVTADSMTDARAKVFDAIGTAWCDLPGRTGTGGSRARCRSRPAQVTGHTVKTCRTTSSRPDKGMTE